MKSFINADGATAKRSTARSQAVPKQKTTGSVEAEINLQQFKFLSKTLPIALAIYKVVFDAKKNPVQVPPLAVNPEFKKALYKNSDPLNNQLTNSFLDEKTHQPLVWSSICCQVATTGKPENILVYSPINKKYYSIYAFRPSYGYCISSFRDITQQREQVLTACAERKKAQEQFKESAEKYDYLVKHSPAAIFEIDYKGPKFKSVNEAVCTLLGFSEQALLATNPLDLLYLESREYIEAAISQVLSGKETFESFEVHVKTKDGTGVWIIVNARITSKTGQGIAALLVAHDITAVKKTKEALYLAEKRYRRLYETTQDGIMARDLDGNMIDCNPAYAKMLGYARKELRRISVKQLLPEKWHEQRDRVVKKVIESGRSIVFEREYKRKDGSIFPASVRTWRLTNGRGKVIGLWSIVRDISPQKRLQKNLEEHAGVLEKIVQDREKQLKDTERLVAIGQTAGMVGHDLRNPLQTLTGELYLAKLEVDALGAGEVKNNLQESIGVIEEQVAYMDKIVSDLQAFVRSVKIDKKPLSLQELVSTVLGTVVIPPNISVQIDNQGDSLQIRADPQLLKRVLINLVTNAVQAMPNGGSLCVGTNVTASGFVSISVKDTGVGIAEKIRNQIFTPLFTTKPRGQGFGLAVCKRVIEAHGGTITFESTEGKGTNFVISFPSS